MKGLSFVLLPLVALLGGCGGNPEAFSLQGTWRDETAYSVICALPTTFAVSFTFTRTDDALTGTSTIQNKSGGGRLSGTFEGEVTASGGVDGTVTYPNNVGSGGSSVLDVNLQLEGSRLTGSLTEAQALACADGTSQTVVISVELAKQ